MRRALPFLLFGIAVITALWLSAQPDRGRPSAARELAETPPVASGPGDTRPRQNAVWPPPTGVEAPKGVPAAQRPQPAPVPEPTSAVEEADPEVVAVLERVLAPNAAAATEDPDTGAPEFDEAAFQWNAAPQGDVFTVVLPQRRKRHESSMDSSIGSKRTPRDAPPLMPIAVAAAPAPTPTPTSTPTPAPVIPPPVVFEPPKMPDLSTLPTAIQQLEATRIEVNLSQAVGWTTSSPD
jgi:hypothetical protein